MQSSFKVSLVVLVALLLAACGTGSAPTPAPDKVSIQLGWTYEFSTAEFYSGIKNGRFAAQNLNVDLQQGGFVNGAYVDPIADVLSGKSDFGLSDDITLSQARADGKPVVAIATILQHSPLAVISLPKSNIRRPQDLVGHKVAVSDGGARLEYNALLQTQNIDPSKVNTIARTDFGADPLIKGDVDAIAGWIVNEGVQVKQAGYEPNIILLSDYGIDSYTNVLFTTDQMVKTKPELVQRFLNATLQGMDDVVKNPSQAIDYTLQYATKLTRDDQTPRLNAMLPLLAPAGSKPGAMDDATWKATYQLEVDQKFLTKPLDITTVYTLDFLNKYYKTGA